MRPGPILANRSRQPTPGVRLIARGAILLTGAYSLAVPLVITPIGVFRLSGAIHGHPILGWALPFFLSSLVLGAVSLIAVFKTRWFVMLWLPLAGIALSGALAFLTGVLWALSGMNIQ